MGHTTAARRESEEEQFRRRCRWPAPLLLLLFQSALISACGARRGERRRRPKKSFIKFQRGKPMPAAGNEAQERSQPPIRRSLWPHHRPRAIMNKPQIGPVVEAAPLWYCGWRGAVMTAGIYRESAGSERSSSPVASADRWSPQGWPRRSNGSDKARQWDAVTCVACLR